MTEGNHRMGNINSVSERSGEEFISYEKADYTLVHQQKRRTFFKFSSTAFCLRAVTKGLRVHPAESSASEPLDPDGGLQVWGEHWAMSLWPRLGAEDTEVGYGRSGVQKKRGAIALQEARSFGWGFDKPCLLKECKKHAPEPHNKEQSSIRENDFPSLFLSLQGGFRRAWISAWEMEMAPPKSSSVQQRRL